jgi:hypothetical protein
MAHALKEVEASESNLNEERKLAHPRWRVFVNSLIASEISVITRFMDRVLSLSRGAEDASPLYGLVEAPIKVELETVDDLGDALLANPDYSAVLLNGTFNHEYDIEGVLRGLWRKMARSSRVVAVMYNPYLRWAYHLANKFGIRQAQEPSTFVTSTDLRNIAKLAGFEVVRVRPVGFLPWRLGGLGTLVNRICAAVPLVRFFSLAWVVALRPIKPCQANPSLTIVIPARNERGNIEAALRRMPDLGIVPEVIFVEGHSSDGTWEEIKRVEALYKDRFPIQSYQQTGKGKADAVRLGFSKADGELLTILDADLTMPPELLGRFYEAWTKGLADFVNGNRLVYPMEGQAMKFLNWLGNIFFAKALSFVLDTQLGDSLCGTKLMSKRDYERFIAWRGEFGDFDPFGDFELIFPACSLGLGVIDVPIRYRDRVYGSTNIRRFYHGMMLFKMTWVGLCRLRFGAKPKLS